jgi:hemoglobin
MCDGKRVTEASGSHSCGCGGHATSVGKTVDAATELILPAVTFPSPRVLEVAGEAKLREAVIRHHELLAAGPIAAMFPADPAAFASLLAKVADFFVETCGGPANYSPAHGNTCMRTRHFPFTIDEMSREVWLAALFQAMEEVDFPHEVREEYWTWLEAFSVRMINRRTMKAQPVRIPYTVAQLRFGRQAGDGLPCGVHMRFCPHG